MANGSAEDEWLRYIFHFNSGLNARFDPDLLKCASQRESVDDCGKHSHVIRRGTVHTAIRRRKTAPDVAAADHYGYFHTQIAHLFHAFGDLAHDWRRDIVAPAVLLHCFAAQLEHDAFIDWCFWFHGGG